MCTLCMKVRLWSYSFGTSARVYLPTADFHSILPSGLRSTCHMNSADIDSRYAYITKNIISKSDLWLERKSQYSCIGTAGALFYIEGTYIMQHGILGVLGTAIVYFQSYLNFRTSTWSGHTSPMAFIIVSCLGIHIYLNDSSTLVLENIIIIESDIRLLYSFIACGYSIETKI